MKNGLTMSESKCKIFTCAEKAKVALAAVKDIKTVVGETCYSDINDRQSFKGLTVMPKSKNNRFNFSCGRSHITRWGIGAVLDRVLS